MKKSTRNKLWPVLEKDIQTRALHKDPKFILKGKWKKFVRNQGGFKIYAVNGKYIRDNLCVYFGHAGHGLVHEFIPMNEIWVGTHHFHEGSSCNSKCGCKLKKKNQPLSKEFFESTIIHEIFEFKKMKKGASYWQAHNLALKEEIKIGLLKNPYADL